MNQPHSRDISDLDLSAAMRHVKGSGLHVSFSHVKVTLKNKDAEHNGQQQTRLCVTKQPKGDRSTASIGFISEEEAKRQFPIEYDHFVKYADAPTTGTPLSELPGISQSQIGLLVLNGLRSIEDLLEVSADQVGQIGLQAVKARKVAEAWNDRKSGAGDIIDNSELTARFETQIQVMNKNMLAMAEQNKVLLAQVEALKAVGGAPATGDEAAGVLAVDGKEDLEHDISKMDDPMTEGPDMIDDMNDLGSDDVDPLMGD